MSRRHPSLAGLLILALGMGAGARADESAADAFLKVPSRCQAAYIGPSGVCQMSGTWVASAVGPTAPKAGQLAGRRLETLLVAEIAERMAHSGGSADLQSAEAQAQGCLVEARSKMHVSCGEEAGLLEQKTCYAAFSDQSCWPGGAVEMEGVAWRAMEKGRDRVCEAMEAHLTEASATPDTLARCRADCLEQAKVTCP